MTIESSKPKAPPAGDVLSEPGPGPLPIIRWNRLTKRIRMADGTTRVVLDMGPMELPAGEFICILGSSGCGKTTMLGILGLVDGEYDGDLTLHLGGQTHRFASLGDLQRSRLSTRLRQNVGFVFQDIRLRLDASAIENVVDPLIYLGRGDTSQRQASADRILRLVNIPERDRGRPVSTFSGGMQQRTGIARALAVEPDLICADEPTAHLDDVLADEIYDDLKRRAREEGITVIVVTHDSIRARRYADRVIRIDKQYGTTEEQDAASLAGEWPFDVAVEVLSEPEGDEVPEERPRTMGPAPLSGRVRDMLGEAIAEFYPLFRQMKWLLMEWPAGVLRWLVSRVRPRSPNPSHLYMPLFVAVATFALLAATGFFFFNLKSGILEYQEKIIDQLQVVRRVRAESPSSAGGTLTSLDLDSIQAFAKDRGVTIKSAQPNYSLAGVALAPDDPEQISHSGLYPSALPIQFSAKSLGQIGSREERKNSRLMMNLLELDPGDPLAQDLGIGEAVDDWSAGLEGEMEIPAIYINSNELDWLKFGQHLEIPKKGDEIQLFFSSVSTVRSVDAETHAGAEKVYSCVRMRVAGYLHNPKASFQFEPKIRSQLIHGVLRRSTFQRILAWQYGPIDQRLPAGWSCLGAPQAVDANLFEQTNASSQPIARSYDFFAASPRAALDLVDVIEQYSEDSGVKFANIVSEEEFIAMVVTYQNVTSFIGGLLEVVPIGVGAILLWMVIQGILQRRREELLLFVVMGAPTWQLQLQCFFISMLIVIPGLFVGWVLGSSLPSLVLTAIPPIGLPEGLLETLQGVGPGLAGLGSLGVVTSVFATLVSAVVVRTITSTNPADVFRGQ